MAADVGADVMRAELALDQLHRAEDRPLRAAGAKARRPARARPRRAASPRRAGSPRGRRGGPGCRRDAGRSARGRRARPSAPRRRCIRRPAASMSLPCSAVCRSAWRRIVARFCSMKLGWPSSTSSTARLPAQKRITSRRHDRVGDVHHVERHLRAAVDVGQAEPLERAHQRVVVAALHDDADVVGALGEELVEVVLLDEAHRRRPALLDLLLLVHVGRGRQHDAAVSRRGVCERVAGSVKRRGAGWRSATNWPCTWQARMRSISITGVWLASESSKPCFTAATIDGRFGPRVEQPDLRLHRERVAALLHDRRALAVVLADDDQRAAGDAARGEVGERVGGDVDADRPLEGDRAAQRVVDRGRERRRGGRLAGRVLEADAVLDQDVLRRRRARPSGARSARPGSRRRRTRPTRAAPW